MPIDSIEIFVPFEKAEKNCASKFFGLFNNHANIIRVI